MATGSQQGWQRDLKPLFAPRSVAIVGASANSAKWGHTLARRAVESPADRRVLLVSQRGGRLLGRPVFASVAEAANAEQVEVDLVIVCVPVESLLSAVVDAVAAGARAIVVITAGLAESSAAGNALEQQLVVVARAGGAVLVGPNCLGVADPRAGLQLAHSEMLDLALQMSDRGIGMSRFVSLGNQADLGVVDFMHSCVDHDGTRAVAVYVEDVGDGREFLAAAQALREAGKPLVLLAPGRTEAAVRGAASHTGALTSSSQVMDAVCAVVGAHRVDHPAQMADLLVALRAPRRMAGRRVAILTDGGGHGAVAADCLAAVGLNPAPLAQPTSSQLRATLGPRCVVSNPVDLAGAGEQDVSSYARALHLLLGSDQVDGVLMTGYFGGYTTEQTNLTQPELTTARQIAETVSAQGKPLVVQTIHPGSPTSRLLRAAGIPVLRDTDRASDVLAGLVEQDRAPGEALPALPPPAPPVSDSSYAAARALFRDAGIDFPVAMSVTDVHGLEAALDTPGLTFPVVLKATGLTHKSERGGVVLGLADPDQARAAYDDLVARLAPPTVSVEAMADVAGGVELIIGCVRDPKFGPIVMVGLGGVFTEVLSDTECAIAPVTAATARRMLTRLRGASLLLGARGSAPVDLEALAEIVSTVSEVAAAHPEIAELELNPVLARADGALALDARTVLVEP
jgi:acyl-CoA synthetase (NDP forming)